MSDRVLRTKNSELRTKNLEPRTEYLELSTDGRKFSVVQFLGVVFVPLGNFDDDVGGAVGHGLATEAGFRRDARRFVQLVELGVGSFVAGFEAFPHDEVAGPAGADAAASVVEAGLDAFGNVEDAAGGAGVSGGDFSRGGFE